MLLLIVQVWAAPQADNPEERFQKAGRFYAAENWPAAISEYKQILEGGYQTPQVYYNLGNAHFKAGNLAPAILNYRQAWYHSPGDPDIDANLKSALNAAGVSPPQLSALQRIIFCRSFSFWIWLAVGGYTIGLLLVGSEFLFRTRKSILFRLAIVPLFILLLSLTGVWQWKNFLQHPEAVLKKDTLARYGPTETSTSYFELPAGSIVRCENEKQSEWIKIYLQNRVGWVKSNCVNLLDKSQI